MTKVTKNPKYECWFGGQLIERPDDWDRMGLHNRYANALRNARILTVDEWHHAGEQEIKNIDGLGKKGVETIRELLEGGKWIRWAGPYAKEENAIKDMKYWGQKTKKYRIRKVTAYIVEEFYANS